MGRLGEGGGLERGLFEWIMDPRGRGVMADIWSSQEAPTMKTNNDKTAKGCSLESKALEKRCSLQCNSAYGYQYPSGLPADLVNLHRLCETAMPLQ